MKPPRRFSHLLFAVLTACALANVGGIAAARDEPPGVEEAQLPPKPQTHEEALAEAVQDGDLPRLEQLLARAPHPRSAAQLACELARRPNIVYCGMPSNLPRVPWTRERFLPVFRRLLRAVPHTEAANNQEKHSLLMAAASLGDLESVRYMVERGANVKYQVPIQTVKVGYPKPTEVGGEFPLLEAVRSGIDDDNPAPGPLVKYLLQKGADANAVDANGLTALLIASGVDDLETVRALLTAGANPNFRTKRGQSPLDWARQQRQKQIALLLAPLTDMNLTEASAMNDTGAIQRLLDAGVAVNGVHPETGETALMAAAGADATDAAKMLLERGAALTPTEREGKNALHIAVENGNVAVTNLLLEHKADPNAPLIRKDDRGNEQPDEWLESRSPLVRAIEAGHLPVVETLLRHGARFDTPKQTYAVASTFARAAGRYSGGDAPRLSRADRSRLLNLLTGAGLSLQESPLAVCAARSAPPELLQTLLDQGASPDCRFVGKPEEGEHTALMATIMRVAMARDAQREMADISASVDDYVRDEREGRACFRLLLRRGAAIDARTNTGATAFMGAVASDSFDLADELLRRGAKINAADGKGRTALHQTVSRVGHANEAALRYLVRRGAARTLRDKNGDTPLSLARKHGFKKAVALLAKK